MLRDVACWPSAQCGDDNDMWFMGTPVLLHDSASCVRYGGGYSIVSAVTLCGSDSFATKSVAGSRRLLLIRSVSLVAIGIPLAGIEMNVMLLSRRVVKPNNTQDAANCAVHPRATQQTKQCVQCKSQRLPKRLQMHSMTMLAPVTEKQNRECDPTRCQCRRVCETTLDTLTMSKLWERHGRSSHEAGRPARWRRDVGRGPPLLDESRSAASCRKQC